MHLSEWASQRNNLQDILQEVRLERFWESSLSCFLKDLSMFEGH